MTSDEVTKFKQRIKELEDEVADRERDLATYRDELNSVNRKLESLITSLNGELKVAHLVQKKLVPTEFPNIPGFEISSKFIPSMIKGGDYYDIFEHEDPNRFGIILASSSGYAMSALLLSVLLKLTGQMEARKGADPSKVLKDMAEELLPSSQVGDEAEVFYGVVDRRTFDLQFCTAGSILGLHQDYSSGTLTKVNSSNKALRLGGDLGFDSNTIQLNPRDRLVFCSPGLLEVENLEGEKFGVDRLLRSIKEAPKRGVHELRNEIIYQAQSHSKGKEPPRDQTVVVLEVKDRVIKLATKG